jgi:hypothetical protein
MSDSMNPRVAADDASTPGPSLEGRGEEAPSPLPSSAHLSPGQAARFGPSRGEGEGELPTFEELAADPEIAALLDFEPVPRQVVVKNGWTPERQREFIARLATHGSPRGAADEVAKDITSARKLYHHPQGGSFADAWEAAAALAQQRIDAAAPPARPRTGTPPGIDRRRKHAPAELLPRPGQVLNEQGEWEDEESLEGRADEAKDSVRMKLLRCRRLFLQEISGSPGKRAAFEVLTELPIDWDKAALLEPQDDEPWNPATMRKPDMVLTAESGWLMGEIGYGPDRKAAARRAIDEHRAAEGQEPVDWSADDPEGEDGK